VSSHSAQGTNGS